MYDDGTVKSAANIVFTRPNQFHPTIGTYGFGCLTKLGELIPAKIAAPPKAAPRKQRLNFDIRRLDRKNLGDLELVDRLDLASVTRMNARPVEHLAPSRGSIGA